MHINITYNPYTISIFTLYIINGNQEIHKYHPQGEYTECKVIHTILLKYGIREFCFLSHLTLF